MAAISNTVTQYDAYRSVREDLANVIYNISPVDTVFMSNIGRGKASQPHFEWQTDALAAPNTANAVIEGDDVASTSDARAATNRVANYMQISRKLISTSGTAEATKMAGKRSELAYQVAKAASELKRDMEAILTSNQVAVVGNDTVARKTAALGAWLITNSLYYGSTTTAAAPVMSSGSDGYPATASVSGMAGATAFTETQLASLLQNVWAQGGDGKMLMVGPVNKRKASAFTGIATRYRDVPAGKQAQIIGAADVYVGDFGTVNVVPNRFQPEQNVFNIDPSYFSVDYLRPFRTEVLAKTGDAQRRMLIVEYGLRCKTEKASGVIRDVTTT